jgi:integrase
MAADFAARMGATNQRLKAARIGVAVEQRGGRLLLRAMLPSKPGSSKSGYHQQRISLHYRANPAGLALAEAEAKQVGALLELGRFTWEPYLTAPKPDTVADWVARFEQDYFTRRERTPRSETTWKGDYEQVFRSLPQDEPLTLAVLVNSIAAKKPDSRARKRWVDICTRLARFASLQGDLAPLRGSYSPSKVSPRNLPSDSIVAQVREIIPNSTWQRVYGLLATYGLRPHEIFDLQFDKYPLLQVGEGTKTGSRLVYPLYPEWAQWWDLQGDLPTVSGRNNSELGNRISKAFKRYQVPFPPYHLRHAWAVRSITFGLELPLAAAQMGHSVRVHCEIYHAWITEEVHQKAYQALLINPNRPSPPD